MEFLVTALGMDQWKWQIVDTSQGSRQTIVESPDFHPSEAACVFDLNRVIDACRVGERPNIRVINSKL
jgi:hypothetical protein